MTLIQIQHHVIIVIILLRRCYGDQCAVLTGDRDLCMFEGVSQTVCENEGCCYDSTTSPNCYYSSAEGMCDKFVQWMIGPSLCWLLNVL